MNRKNTGVDGNARRLLKYQIAVGIVTAIVFFFWKGTWEAVSVIFGVAAASASVKLLGSGVARASEQALHDPKTSMGILYFGAVKRFLLVLGFFIVGLALIKLDALSMCAGFILAQLGFLVNVRRLSRPAD